MNLEIQNVSSKQNKTYSFGIREMFYYLFLMNDASFPSNGEVYYCQRLLYTCINKLLWFYTRPACVYALFVVMTASNIDG